MCVLAFLCPNFQWMHSSLHVGCACCVYVCLHILYANTNAEETAYGHCYVIHGTSRILERHYSLQGERANPLHHHYHYHHQSFFEWRSWIQQCTEPLAWLHLDIAFEMGKMDEENGLH